MMKSSRTPSHPNLFHQHVNSHDRSSMVPTGSASPCSSPQHEYQGTPPYLKWAQSFFHLMDDQDGVLLFQDYLSSEGVADYLKFWIACRGLKRADEADTSLINKYVSAIYKKYIKTGVLSDGLKEATRSHLCLTYRRIICGDDKDKEKPGACDQSKELCGSNSIINFSKNIFDDAQKEIEEMITSSFYDNFLRSEFYLNYLSCQQNEGFQPECLSNTNYNHNHLVLSQEKSGNNIIVNEIESPSIATELHQELMSPSINSLMTRSQMFIPDVLPTLHEDDESQTSLCTAADNQLDNQLDNHSHSNSRPSIESKMQSSIDIDLSASLESTSISSNSLSLSKDKQSLMKVSSCHDQIDSSSSSVPFNSHSNLPSRTSAAQQHQRTSTKIINPRQNNMLMFNCADNTNLNLNEQQFHRHLSSYRTPNSSQMTHDSLNHHRNYPSSQSQPQSLSSHINMNGNRMFGGVPDRYVHEVYPESGSSSGYQHNAQHKSYYRSKSMSKPPNPYHVKYSSFLPTSAQDSELQSLSSGITDDSMSALSASNDLQMLSGINGMNNSLSRSSGAQLPHARKQLKHDNLFMKQNAKCNPLDSQAYSMQIPRTLKPKMMNQKLHDLAEKSPREFYDLLSEKLNLWLEKERQTRELHGKLQDAVAGLQDNNGEYRNVRKSGVGSASAMNNTCSSPSANVHQGLISSDRSVSYPSGHVSSSSSCPPRTSLRDVVLKEKMDFSAFEDSDQSILDQHISRVFDETPNDTPNKPGLISPRAQSNQTNMSNINNNVHTNSASSNLQMPLRVQPPLHHTFYHANNNINNNNAINLNAICSNTNTSASLSASLSEPSVTICYKVSSETVPYIIKLPGPSSNITFKRFKQHIQLRKGIWRYYFKRKVERDEMIEFGAEHVQEEITKDEDILPLCDGRIIASIELVNSNSNTNDNNNA